jgi:hypothetical protein
MLRALPVAKPQQLSRIGDAVTCCYSMGDTQGNQAAQNDWTLFSWEARQVFRADTPAFEELFGADRYGIRRAGRAPSGFRSGGPGASERVRLRQFLPDVRDLRVAQASVHRRRRRGSRAAGGGDEFHTWQESYGSDLSIVGATYEINGHAFTVIGVAPPGFFGAKVDASNMPDLWLPLARNRSSPAPRLG